MIQNAHLDNSMRYPPINRNLAEIEFSLEGYKENVDALEAKTNNLINLVSWRHSPRLHMLVSQPVVRDSQMDLPLIKTCVSMQRSSS